LLDLAGERIGTTTGIAEGTDRWFRLRRVVRSSRPLPVVRSFVAGRARRDLDPI
jgi:hypothetical protein